MARHDIRFGIWTGQSKPWAETLDEWRLVERLGFDCAGLCDHFMPTNGDDDGWYHEGWTMLAALAALVPRVRLSILVSGNTYRHPALLAKEAATIDHISGGRVDLGIGAGWFTREHDAFGWELHSPGERVAKLEEALQVIDALFRDRRSSFDGRYYRLDDAPFQPKPVQDHMPIMIGCQRPKMLRLVARYADIWNVNHNAAAMAKFGATLNQACEEIGRDPGEIRWSAFAFDAVLDQDPFGSVDGFRNITEDYLAAGATEIYYRMPETGHGIEAMQRVAEILDDYRGPDPDPDPR